MRTIYKKEIDAVKYLKGKGYVVVSPEEQEPIKEEDAGESPDLGVKRRDERLVEPPNPNQARN